MEYTLIGARKLVAQEPMRCDGIGVFKDMMECKSGSKEDIKLDKQQDILMLMQNKDGLIKKNEFYVEYLFVGQDAQEYVLNVSSRMVPILKRNNFFKDETINHQIRSHEGIF